MALTSDTEVLAGQPKTEADPRRGFADVKRFLRPDNASVLYIYVGISKTTGKLTASLGREQALRKSFDEQRAETLTQNEAAINARIIQQEIDTNKSLLNSLLQGAKENDVVIAGKPNNISRALCLRRSCCRSGWAAGLRSFSNTSTTVCARRKRSNAGCTCRRWL